MTVLKGVTAGGSSAPSEILDYTKLVVPSEATTTLAVFSAPSVARIASVIVSGTVYGYYSLFLNTAQIAAKQTYPNHSTEFFLNLGLVAGNLFEVKVYHCSTRPNETFEATILGF